MSIEGASGPIVVDIGSSTVRAGFAGASKPSLIASSVVGTREGDLAFPINYDIPRENMEIHNVGNFSHPGASINDEYLCGMLGAVLNNEHTGTRPSSDGFELSECNPVLISEPSVQNNVYRQKVIQLLFEKMGARGAFVCKRSVLSAFSLGKTNAVVVSVGAQVSSISCVAGGHSYPHLTTNWNVAGNAIDTEILARLSTHSSVNFLPKSHQNTTSSFKKFAESMYISKMKEEICRVSENRDLRVHVDNAAYQLPDGTRIDCSRISQSVAADILFSSSLKKQSLSTMMKEVVDKCKTSDENLAQTLLQSVVVCGGTSAMTGFVERAQNEFSISSQSPVKCYAGITAADKQHSAWIGGSIVASLGNFNTLWITKREYEEHGVGIVGKKCP